MPTEQRFVVKRAGENTVAFVTLKLEGAIQDPATGKAKLVAACTQWARKTNEGRHAWELEANEGFNVGDLALYQDSKELAPFLAEQGVMSLEVTTMEGAELDWEFDDHLVNSEEAYDTEEKET